MDGIITDGLGPIPTFTGGILTVTIMPHIATGIMAMRTLMLADTPVGEGPLGVQLFLTGAGDVQVPVLAEVILVEG